MRKSFITLLLASLSLNSFAHAPFTAPSSYLVSGDNSSILAGFAEKPFDSEVAIRGFDFKVLNPKAQLIALELSHTASLSSANVATTVDGTYQILAERSQAIEYAKVGQRWLRVLDAKGAQVPPLDVRSFILPTELNAQHERFAVQRQDRLLSYFSKYQSSDLAQQPNQAGMTLAYSRHPNHIRAGQNITLHVKLNQQAAAGYKVLVEQQAQLGQSAQNKSLSTDAKGQVQLEFPTTGQYLISISSPEAAEQLKPEAMSYRTMVSLNIQP